MVSFRDTPEEAAFRQEVREFIEERLPSELRGQVRYAGVGAMGPALEAAQARSTHASARNAIAGDVIAARLAGMTLDTTATQRRTTDAPTSVRTSRGSTP